MSLRLDDECPLQSAIVKLCLCLTSHQQLGSYGDKLPNIIKISIGNENYLGSA